jgi:hypothetical protein
MQIKISKEELAKNKLFIATPMYGGMCTGAYMKSCIDLQSLCANFNIGAKFSFIFNESLIQRARNYLTDEFFSRSDCTHLLFIDADISFNPQDVLALLALSAREDIDIIGAPYAKKSIEWGQLHKGLKKNPNLPLEDYSKLTGAIVFNPVGGTSKFSVTEPLEVMDLGTGFMLIKRSVFEKFQEAYPEKMYKPDHVGQAHFDGTREICAFFDCVIDPQSKRYLSEDYYFTQHCRKLGLKVWMCPWMKMFHTGTYSFQSDLPAIAQHIGEL